MFTLAISCLTTSNLPWFMDLTFQVPMKYCSLQHQDFTFTTRHIHNWASFLLWPNHFSPAASFFLEWLVIALCSSTVACCRPSVLGGSSSDVISFCLFIVFLGLLQQEYWRGLPFPPPVDHVLSELFTIIRLSWVALHGMIELCRPSAMTRLWSLKGLGRSKLLLISSIILYLFHQL